MTRHLRIVPDPGYRHPLEQRPTFEQRADFFNRTGTSIASQVSRRTIADRVTGLVVAGCWRGWQAAARAVARMRGAIR
jgi:hypothetical protein